MVTSVHERCSDKSCHTDMERSCSKSKAPRPIGEAVHRVVGRAKAENRLVTGVLDVCEHLQSCRGRSTVLCLITEMSAHTGLYKLVEAFCREYLIRLLMVKNIHTKDVTVSPDESSGIQQDDDLSDYVGLWEESDKMVENPSPKPCATQTAKCLQNRKTGQTIWPPHQQEVTCMLIKTGDRMTPEEEFLIAYHDMFRSFVSDRFPCVEVSCM